MYHTFKARNVRIHSSLYLFFHILCQDGAFECLQRKFIFIPKYIRSLAASLGNGYGPGIHIYKTAMSFAPRDMCMPMQKNKIFSQWRYMIFIIQMPVSRKNFNSSFNKNGLVRHDGKFQNLLIHLGLTVAANGKNHILLFIQ